MKKISIITPCFNEEDNVEICAAELKKIMSEKLSEYEYEHIFADNASTDLTLDKLRIIASKDRSVKVISNSRNVGPFRNMWNAMKSATGDAIIPLLPADLQDPVDVIPKFVRNWENGDLIVYGVRTKREEFLLMRIFRKSYYYLIRKFAYASIPMNSGEFLLADKRVIESVISVDDQYPYIRGLIAQTSAKSSSISYKWVKRKNGKSKNSFIDLFDQAINGFVSTSKIPARITLFIGMVLSIIGIGLAVISTIFFAFSDNQTSTGIPIIIISIFLFSGTQLFFMGILGEYILSIHGQVRKTPPMFELERLNFGEKNEN